MSPDVRETRADMRAAARMLPGEGVNVGTGEVE